MHRSLGLGLTGRLSQLRVKKCAILHEECRRGAHLPSLGREPVSNKCIAVRKVATPLRELTCHMRSHSVICHPAEVTFPPLPQVGGLSTVTFPVAGRHRFLTGTKFYYSATELRVCEQFA